MSVAGGIRAKTLQSLVEEVFNLVYPVVKDQKKNVIPVDFGDIDKIEIDAAAPSINLRPDVKSLHADVAKAVTSFVAKAPTDASVDHEKLINGMMSRVDNCTFEVVVPAKLKLHMKTSAEPTAMPATVKAMFSIHVDNQKNTLNIKLLAVNIEIPKKVDPTGFMTSAANAVLPKLQTFLTEKMFHEFNIPALKFANLTLSAPVPLVGCSGDCITAYASILPAKAKPTNIEWPVGTVNVSVDTNALYALVALEFPLGPKKSFSKGIFSGQLSAQVSVSSIGINSDGSITGKITADATAQLGVDVGLFGHKINIGPRGAADATVTFGVGVDENKVFLTAKSVPTLAFHFDLGLPGPIAWLANKLISLLTTELNNLIAPEIQRKHIRITSIPLIKQNMLDKTLQIEFSSVETEAIGGLLVLKAKPKLTLT